MKQTIIMAKQESFDILDQLGSSQKVEELKTKVEKSKAKDILNKLDEIEAKIEEAAGQERSSAEIIEGIIDANFNSLNSDVNNTEKDLQELMLHLRAMLDSAGGEFQQLQELNETELALIEKANNSLTKAENDLKEANAMSNGWNILFGYKRRKIANSQTDLNNAKENLKLAKEEANKLYRNRLRNADIEESLDRIIRQVTGMIGIIEGMIEETVGQIDILKNRKEVAFATKEKAAEIMEERKNDLEKIEAELTKNEEELTQMQNNTPEYTEQQKKIADLREQRAELKGKFNIALGIFQSKERFVDQIMVHLEAQTTTKNNLKQLIGQLRSDTEERVATYQSGLQLIQAATAQEAASIYEEAGVKTDQKITEIAAKIFTSSEKDRIERIKKHPKRLAELHQVLVAMAEATAKFKEEDTKIVEEHSKKFNIDISEQFSSRYEKSNKNEPDNSKNKRSTIEDLLD